MEIFGIGTDIVNTKRFNKIFNKYGNNFINKIFSKKEIIYCNSKNDSMASFSKRFAAKEAFSKAIGTGFGKGLSLKNIEIINNKSGKPSIRLSGSVLKKVKSFT